MSVQVYGCNHVAIEVDNLAKAQAFYEDAFSRGEIHWLDVFLTKLHLFCTVADQYAKLGTRKRIQAQT
jgi:hypothetical protein